VNLKPLYLAMDMVKVSKLSSKYFHTSLVQDPMVGFGKKNTSNFFVCYENGSFECFW